MLGASGSGTTRRLPLEAVLVAAVETHVPGRTRRPSGTTHRRHPGRSGQERSVRDRGRPPAAPGVLVTVPIGASRAPSSSTSTCGDRDASRQLIGLGILSSLPAAATGLSDWSDTEGAERRVGLVHAASNTVGLALLTASWLSRRGGGGGRLLALAGFGVMGAGGWLGGHLSYALGVGVDTTAFMSPPTDWTDVCAETDLLEGQSQSFTVEDMPVLLVRHEGRVRPGRPLHPPRRAAARGPDRRRLHRVPLARQQVLAKRRRRGARPRHPAAARLRGAGQRRPRSRAASRAARTAAEPRLLTRPRRAVIQRRAWDSNP